MCKKEKMKETELYLEAYQHALDQSFTVEEAEFIAEYIYTNRIDEETAIKELKAEKILKFNLK